MELLKGKPVADAKALQIKERVNSLKAKGVRPCLGILRVGAKPDDIAYEGAALKRAESLGIDVKKFLLPEDAKKEDLVSLLDEINNDKNVHGLLPLKPMPNHMGEDDVLNMLDRFKDIDGITSTSMAALYRVEKDVFAPCTAEACMALLEYYGVELEGKNALVIGRSLVIGKPVSLLLQNKNATVTMCHSRTRNLKDMLVSADIVVVAAGKRALVTTEDFKDGQVILDVGINFDDQGKMCGDVVMDELHSPEILISPVPGGVGSVTTYILCEHVVRAAEIVS